MDTTGLDIAKLKLLRSGAQGRSSGRSGACLFKFLSLPAPDQFELRGYTQLPAGNPFDGIVVRSLGARPQFFDHSGDPSVFIPGLGVEQWELKRGLVLPAMELARLAPDQKFTQWR